LGLDIGVISGIAKFGWIYLINHEGDYKLALLAGLKALYGLLFQPHKY